jgi:hypothetical protein
LAAYLANDFSAGMPAAVNDAIEKAIVDEQRTLEQVIERLERRWLHWSYENDAVADSGRGLDRPLGVLLTLLAPSSCWGNHSRCEDGIDIDTGADCPRCAEAREDKSAGRSSPEPAAGGYSVPFQRPADAAPSQYVRCLGSGCGVKMLPSEDGLCRECREYARS